jgi:hypothetical protein
MLPPDEELLQELRTPMYSVTGSEIRITKSDILREMLGRSLDKASSLVLTFAPSTKRQVSAW